MPLVCNGCPLGQPPGRPNAPANAAWNHCLQQQHHGNNSQQLTTQRKQQQRQLHQQRTSYKHKCCQQSCHQSNRRHRQRCPVKTIDKILDYVDPPDDYPTEPTLQPQRPLKLSTTPYQHHFAPTNTSQQQLICPTPPPILPQPSLCPRALWTLARVPRLEPLCPAVGTQYAHFSSV